LEAVRVFFPPLSFLLFSPPNARPRKVGFFLPWPTGLFPALKNSSFFLFSTSLVQETRLRSCPVGRTRFFFLEEVLHSPFSFPPRVDSVVLSPGRLVATARVARLFSKLTSMTLLPGPLGSCSSLWPRRRPDKKVTGPASFSRKQTPVFLPPANFIFSIGPPPMPFFGRFLRLHRGALPKKGRRFWIFSTGPSPLQPACSSYVGPLYFITCLSTALRFPFFAGQIALHFFFSALSPEPRVLHFRRARAFFPSSPFRFAFRIPPVPGCAWPARAPPGCPPFSSF